MSKKAIKRRVSAAVKRQHALVMLVDQCDSMIEDMESFGFEPGGMHAFRDLVIDRLHGAEEELSDACTSATLAGIKLYRVRTRQPISFMRAEHLRQSTPDPDEPAPENGDTCSDHVT